MFYCGTACFHSYKYDTVIQGYQNDSVNIAACADPLKTEDVLEIQIEPSVEDNNGKTVGYTLGSNMVQNFFLNKSLALFQPSLECTDPGLTFKAAHLLRRVLLNNYTAADMFNQSYTSWVADKSKLVSFWPGSPGARTNLPIPLISTKQRRSNHITNLTSTAPMMSLYVHCRARQQELKAGGEKERRDSITEKADTYLFMYSSVF